MKPGSGWAMKAGTKKWVLWIALPLLVVALLGGLVLGLYGSRELAGYRRALVTKGERLTLAEFVLPAEAAAVDAGQTLLVDAVRLSAYLATSSTST